MAHAAQLTSFDGSRGSLFGSLGANLRTTATLGLFAVGVDVTAFAVMATMSAKFETWVATLCALPIVLLPISFFMTAALRRKRLLLGGSLIFMPVVAWAPLAVIALQRPDLIIPGCAGLYFVMCLVCRFLLPDVWPRREAAGAQARAGAITCPHCGEGFVPALEAAPTSKLGSPADNGGGASAR